MSKKILIVDDDANWGKTLGEWLERPGYEIEIALDPVNAMRGMLKSPPHLVLLDIMMPGGGGFGLLKNMRINTRLCKIPVIVITANPDVTNEEVLKKPGIAGCFLKPVEMGALFEKIKEQLS